MSIGVGPTKTLAKLANRLAKKSPKAAGVLDLAHHPQWIEAALRKTPVGDVWGIGRRLSAMLEGRGVCTAYDLSRAPDGWVRQRMGVVGLRTVHELRGLVCYALDDQPAAKQTTCDRGKNGLIRLICASLSINRSSTSTTSWCHH